jgi:hypothetical protein
MLTVKPAKRINRATVPPHPARHTRALPSSANHASKESRATLVSILAKVSGFVA